LSRSRSREFLEKSISVMITAIEAYNKPDHKYREESFSILVLNAWEIFLKAKILLENNNDFSSICVYEKKTLKNGCKSKRKYIRRNRSGNPMTIGLRKAISIIENDGLESINNDIKANINALMEIRDNSIHLINLKTNLSETIQGLGTATLINYMELMKKWFDTDLQKYNFYLMPLSFFRDFDSAFILNLTKEETNLTKYLNTLQSNCADNDKDSKFAFSLKLNVRLEKSKLPTAAKLAVGENPNAIPLTLSEEERNARYPWPYIQLTEKLRNRYKDFKANAKYHNIRKKFIDDKRYVYHRYLDPNNKNSQKKDFYSPNILHEFDKYYKRFKK
jgi:predicted HicB family RNase H-like nuclease